MHTYIDTHYRYIANYMRSCRHTRDNCNYLLLFSEILSIPPIKTILNYANYFNNYIITQMKTFLQCARKDPQCNKINS